MTALIACKPHILTLSLKSKLVPSFNFLKCLLHTNEKVIKTIKLGSWFLYYNFEKVLIPNVSLLQNHGIPIAHISRLLLNQPQKLVLKADKFSEIIIKVKELGFDSCSPYMFIEAICSIGTQSKWDEKFMVYRSLGWSEMDFLSAIRKRPRCMLMSDEKIRRWMDFFLNKLGLKSSDISCRPNLLLYSLEQRIIPRCTVLQLLASKNLIGKNLTVCNLQRFIQMSERQFLKNYVIKHQNELPDVLKAYQGEIKFSKLNIKA